MKKTQLFVVLALVLLLSVPSLCEGDTVALYAEDFTESCTLSPRSPTNGIKPLYDRKYTTPWRSREERKPYLEVKLPAGEACYQLYICFANMPTAWEIQVMEDGKWVSFLAGDTAYMHTLMQLPGLTHFRIASLNEKKSKIEFNEIFVFGEGELPPYVQQWEPTAEKADLMILVAHPDDELLFMGGALPYYQLERQRQVVVCYMSFSNTTRRSELLNGLWSMGIRQYPIIGDFHDTYSSTLNDAYKRWKKDDAQQFVIGLLRQYKPEVLVSHDINGEYGHGAHKLCADVSIWATENSGDGNVCPESAEAYGLWDVKKLYLHLYAENSIFMNWRTPYESLGGKSPMELAHDAYHTYHVTQQNTKFEVTDEGPNSNGQFGLYRTLVGPDINKDDFLENIE